MIQKHGDLPLPRRIARLYPFLRGKQHLMCATVKAGLSLPILQDSHTPMKRDTYKNVVCVCIYKYIYIYID